MHTEQYCLLKIHIAVDLIAAMHTRTAVRSPPAGAPLSLEVCAGALATAIVTRMISGRLAG